MGSKVKEHTRIYLLILDLISIIISFFLTTQIRYGILIGDWYDSIYGLLFIILILSHVCLYFFYNPDHGLFKRGFYDEFLCVFKENFLLALLVTGIFFIYQKGAVYSRIFLVCFFFCNICFNFVTRQYFKVLLLSYYKKSGSSSKVVVITTFNSIVNILDTIRNERLWEYLITGIVIFDQDMAGEKISDIPVIANSDNLYDVITKEVVDEVFISLPNDMELDDMVLEFEQMGIIVRLNLSTFSLKINESKLTEFGGYYVLTFSTTVFNWGAMALKRLIDIVGAIIGLILTAIISLVVAPAILIESRGPLIFSQVRVGKNGRRFNMYKFRSMYKDAEARKKDLMNQNEMMGPMFKIENDPRITKVGKLIRKTSIDEFPQFWNVLKGDMSLVGTRPPTEEEFLQYEGRHKRRLTLKPGITGLWQVSGRSNIKNFEDIVKLDLEYIDHWSINVDIKILFKTIRVLFNNDGAE